MRPRLRALVATLAAGLTALTPTVAQAAPARAAQHCVVDVAVANAPLTCHGTFAQAIAQATGGRITGARQTDQGLHSRLEQANREATLAATSVLIALEYSDDDYEGSSLVVTAPWGCDADLSYDYSEWRLDTLPEWWNDQIESYKTFSGCRARHYLDIYRYGPWLGYSTSWGDLYWLNDEVSSIEWT